MNPIEDVMLFCKGCGWTVKLPINDGKLDTGPVAGWEIKTDERRVFCERCSTGWRPQSDVPDGWAKVNGKVVQVVAIHMLTEQNHVPTGHYALLDTAQYEASRSAAANG